MFYKWQILTQQVQRRRNLRWFMMEKIVNLPFPNSDGQQNIDSGMLKALKVLYVDALKYSKVYIV